MLIGQQGVKYGLTVPKQQKKQSGPTAKKKSVFEDDDSDDDPQQTVEQQIARQAARKQTDKKVADIHAAALAVDPSIFDYDAHYDEIQQSRVEPKRQEKVQRQSKYIASLLEKAEERKIEQSIQYERQLAKERAAEDHLFGDKERFVTAAYRKKLEEDQKWLEQEKKKKEQEERDAVEKKGHMGDFYRTLFRQNVAFGAKPSEKPKQQEEAKPSEEEPVEPDWGAGDLPAARAHAPSYTASGSFGDEQRAAAGKGKPAAAPSGWESASAARDGRAGASGPSGSTRDVETQQAEHSERDGDREEVPRERPAAVAGGAADEEGLQAQEQAAAPAAEAGQRRNRDEAVAAARERYLARKRKAGQV